MTENKGIGRRMPVAPLKLIVLDSFKEMGKRIDEYIVDMRQDYLYPDPTIKPADTYLLGSRCPRFGSGESKGEILGSIRGVDLFIMADVCNHSMSYKINGKTHYMSPDDHFQDIKRIIAAANGKAKRVNVITPFLYESRQHKRELRESLDAAMGLQELVAMGVTNIITFDAHDPRVVNAIPIDGFESFSAYYQFMIAVFNAVPDIRVNPQELMIISPDEGAMGRAVYLANVLGVDMGMFYKRRDYTRLVNGRNPIIAHEFLGSDLKDKDVIVVDDMISSGDSMLDVCRQLKERGAARIVICATFGLFTNGMKVFDEYYEKGMFHKLITTNLVYQDPELLSRPYYETADMAKYLALIIDSLNHSKPISQTIDPSERIHNLLREQTVKNLMHI